MIYPGCRPPSASRCRTCPSSASGSRRSPSAARRRPPPSAPAARRRSGSARAREPRPAHHRPLPPYRRPLSTVLALIVVSAGLGMVSPFLLRAVLDEALPERDRGLLAWLVGGMIAVSIVTGRAGRRPDLPVQRRRPARHARPARRRLRAPAAAVAGVLHAHAHGRGAVADRQRHRRRAERRHHDGDVDHLQRDDGRRDHRRDVRARLAAGRRSRSPCCRSSSACRGGCGNRRRALAATRQGAMADICRARPGVAQRVRHPARQDDGPLRGARRALRGRVAQPRRPRGPLADGRPLVDGRRADVVRGRCRRSSTCSPASRRRR